MDQAAAPILTFVLAVKDPDEAQFHACVSSMAALKNAFRCDLVIVSDRLILPVTDLAKRRLHDVRIIHQEPQGVYQAYNRGLDDLRSCYVMVIGYDDLVLPGLDDVINSIPEHEKPHLVAACSLMQNVGISRPTALRWGLIFRNWCQQGLLYRSDLFATKRFDARYKMQADHKFNMELVSDPRTVIHFRSDIISHFSCSGVSQTFHDWLFRKDMPSIVRSCYGNMFWVVALVKRFLADVFKRRSRCS